MPRTLPILAFAVVLAACVQGSTDSGASDSGSGGGTTTTTLGRLGLEQATLEFSACMRGQGIDMPDIRLDAQSRPILDELRTTIDTTTAAFRMALGECAPILTNAGALDLRGDPELQAVIVSQLGAFAECARTEGLESFPDPDPAFSGIGSPFPSEAVPFTDPDFDEVVSRCQDTLGSIVFDQG